LIALGYFSKSTIFFKSPEVDTVSAIVQRLNSSHKVQRTDCRTLGLGLGNVSDVHGVLSVLGAASRTNAAVVAAELTSNSVAIRQRAVLIAKSNSKPTRAPWALYALGGKSKKVSSHNTAAIHKIWHAWNSRGHHGLKVWVSQTVIRLKGLEVDAFWPVIGKDRFWLIICRMS
jgi:hypothetical protein